MWYKKNGGKKLKQKKKQTNKVALLLVSKLAIKDKRYIRSQTCVKEKYTET